MTTYQLTTFESLLRRERDDAARIHATNRLAAVDDALQTLHTHPEDYGICVKCGRQIDSDRLSIVPATRYCEDDAERRVSRMSSV